MIISHAYRIECATYVTGMPSLRQYQKRKRTLKAAKTHGVQVETFVQLQGWAVEHLIPDTREEMVPYKTYALPTEWHDNLGVEAVVLTAHVQVEWIGQLAKVPRRFVLHIDGKHKLHHGKMLLVTIGTHSMFRSTRKKITHSFRPLLYMLTLNMETTDSIVYLLKALNR